jgi:hypothetical protein
VLSARRLTATSVAVARFVAPDPSPWGRNRRVNRMGVRYEGELVGAPSQRSAREGLDRRRQIRSDPGGGVPGRNSGTVEGTVNSSGGQAIRNEKVSTPSRSRSSHRGRGSAELGGLVRAAAPADRRVERPVSIRSTWPVRVALAAAHDRIKLRARPTPSWWTSPKRDQRERRSRQPLPGPGARPLRQHDRLGV